MSDDHNLSKPAVGPSGRKIIYDKDGKPCRSCNTLLDFRMANISTKSSSGSSSSSTFTAASLGAAVGAPISTEAKKNETASGYAKDCPPDVTQLGRSSWTFLHSLAATYPERATTEQQQDMATFIGLFSKLYPCWFCAKDFQQYISKEETKPRVKTQEEFGKWLCEAHNEVNVKLGKPVFDCNLWKQRWKDGWEDGRCD